MTGSIDGVSHTLLYTGTETDYSSADAPINADTYTVTLSAGGVSVSDTFTISPKNIANCTVSLSESSFTYNGKAPELTVTAVDNGVGSYTMQENTDYTVGTVTGTNVGNYKLIVTGNGNYGGTAQLDYSITAKEIGVLANAQSKTYGEADPELTYTVSGLAEGEKLTKEPTLTTNADATTAGSYVITVANADAGDNYEITYINGTLTIMNAETEVETRIEKTALTVVPDGLKDTEFNTVEAITEELVSRILAVSTGFAEENMEHYDVTLQFSLDGGNTWVLATEENFPTGGITVTLPYPEGTNAAAYDFVVSHMFTVTSQRLGTTAGDVELPKVEETASGIRVTLKGLSPVSLAWKATAFDVKTASASNGTVTTNVSKATAGTEVTITVTPKSGYKMATLTVKDSSGKSYAVSTDNNGKYYFTMPSADVTVTATFSKISTATADPTNPKTGDDFHLVMWSGMAMASLLCMAALILNKKRFYQK